MRLSKNIKISGPGSIHINRTPKCAAKIIKEIDSLEIVKEIKELDKIKSLLSKKKFKNKNLVFFGLGGSSLGIKTIVESLNHKAKFKNSIYIIDNVDGEYFEEIFNEINIKFTNFIFISKSGDTFEIKNLLTETLKKIKLKGIKINSCLYFITENNNGYLNKFARKNNIETFHVNPNIGGRFSVLSKSSLVPCEMMNIKWKEIISAAISCYELHYFEGFKRINYLANFYYKNLLKNKSNTGLISYKNNLNSFGEWFMQLWGESLGKTRNDGVEIGLTPSRYLGPKDQHSQLQLILDGPKDKTITLLYAENSISGNKSLHKSVLKEKLATSLALDKKRVPHVELEMKLLDEKVLGELFLIFELTTILLAKKMKINAFDQPAVELIKKYL
jgi:glucose-6-phosphate isomerase